MSSQITDSIQLYEHFLQNEKSKDQQKTFSVREILRNLYIKLLRTDPIKASQTHTVQLLWKNCFYREIQLLKPPKTQNPQIRLESSKKYTETLRNVKCLFERLLSELSSYLFPSQIPDCSPKEATRSAKRVCYNLFIVLGDLERYIQIARKPQSFWQAAAEHYRAALALIPSRGRAHNQIASLSIHAKEPVSAAYHFVRALFCAHPFEAAKTNLDIFLKANSKLFRHGLKHSNFGSVESYVHSLQSIHSLQIVIAHLFAELLSAKAAKPGKSFRTLKTAALFSLKRALLLRVGSPQCASQTQRSIRSLLLQILVLSLFAFHAGALAGSTCGGAATCWLFDFAAEVMDCLELRRADLLSLVVVFCEFLDRNESLGLLNGELPEEEEASMRSFWRSFAKTLNFLKLVDERTPKGAERTGVFLLEEFRELSGFLLVFPKCTPKRDRSGLVILPLEKADAVRSARIKAFAEAAMAKYGKIRFDRETETYSASQTVATSLGSYDESESDSGKLISFTSEEESFPTNVSACNRSASCRETADTLIEKALGRQGTLILNNN